MSSSLGRRETAALLRLVAAVPGLTVEDLPVAGEALAWWLPEASTVLVADLVGGGELGRDPDGVLSVGEGADRPPPARRRRPDVAVAHAAVAVALHQRRQRGERIQLALLADHVSRGGTDLGGAAPRVLREASAAYAHRPEQAERRGRWLAVALQETPDQAVQRGEILRELIDTYRSVNGWTRIVETLESEPRHWRELFAGDLSLALHALHRYEDALSVLEQVAEDSLPPETGLQKARTLLMLERFDESIRVIEAVRDAGPPPPYDTGADIGLVTVAALHADARRLRRLRAEVGCRMSLEELRDAVTHGDFASIERAVFDVDVVPVPARLSALLSTVHRGFGDGQWDEALECGSELLRSAIGEGVEPSPVQRTGVRAVCGQVLLARGEVSEAAELIAECTATGITAQVVARARAGLALALGRPDRARRQLAGSVDRAQARGLVAGTSALFELLVELDLASDREAALVRLGELRQMARRSGSRHDLACLNRAAARVEDDADLARQAARLDGEDRPFDRARSLMLVFDLDRRDTAAATEAHRVFSALEAAAWRRPLARMMKADGIAVPRMRGSGDVVQLRRQRVVALVADGRTNRQIARRLGVSTKTVESDLTRIYADLGHHSRADLARAAATGDLPRGISPGVPPAG